MSVQVLVPIKDAVVWDPWLTLELAQQAGRLGLGYDGGEEDGPFEVFDFEGNPEQVEQAVIVALAANGVVGRTVTRADNLVVVASQDRHWLVPLAPKDGAYAKALHRIAGQLAGQYAAWWADTGLTRLTFHESDPVADFEPGVMVPGPDHQRDGELYVMLFADLSILDEEPTKAEAEQVAREHLLAVLDGVAEHLGKPLP